MILDRYVIKEVVPNVLIGLMVFTFVMLMNQILLLAETLITRGIEFTKMFLFIFYLLPAFTVLTIPMSLLLGVLLGLGRLNGDSELTVMRASGIGLQRIMLPILLIACVCWGISSYLIHVSVPWGNHSLNKMMFEVMTTNAASGLKPRTFYNQFRAMRLYVQDIPTGGENVWNGVFIYDETQYDKPRLLLAEKGIVTNKAGSGDLELKLLNGSWHEVDPRNPEDYTSASFLENTFPLPSPFSTKNMKIPKTDRDQTVSELRKSVQEHKAKKLPYRYLEVEIHKKYAIPFACFIFSFLATGLGVGSKKGGRSSAYAISIGIILIYYIFLIGGERFGDAGTITPWLAAWSGNILMGIVGLILFLQSNNNLVVKAYQAFQRWRKKAAGMAARPEGASAGGRKRVKVVIRIERMPFRLFTLLDKYIVREFIRNFVLIVLALCLIAELIVATQLVDDLFKSNAGLFTLIQYLKFEFPQWVFYVMPVAALTTTLVTFGMFTKNSEIIAMKASGVSLYRISMPLIILSILLSGFAFWLQDYILPYTNKVANNYKDRVKGIPSDLNTMERHWITDSQGFYNYNYYDSRNQLMNEFSIYLVDMKNFSLTRRMYARQAFFREGAWTLRHGWERTFQRGKIKYDPFKSTKVKLSVNPEYFRTEEELPSEMTFAELKDYINRMRQLGYDVVRFAVDLQSKLSFPTVTLILTLIAIPFSFAIGRRGALYGIGISIVMGIVFWFFLAVTKSLGYLQILGPFLAAWTPNILASMLALYLLFKLRT